MTEQQHEIVNNQEEFGQLLQQVPVEFLQQLPDLDAVVERLLSRINETVDTDLIKLSLLHGDKLHEVSSLQHYPDLDCYAIVNMDDHPLLKTSMDTRTPLFIADVRKEPLWNGQGKIAWVRSHISLPLYTQDHFLGFIFLHNKSPHGFQQSDVKRLLPLMAQTSLAIHLSQLYEQQETTASELEALYNATSVLLNTDNVTELGQQIAQAVVVEFDHVDCGIILIDLYGPQLIRLPRAGIEGLSTNEPLRIDGAGLVPSAIRTGETVYAADVLLDERYVANVPQARSELVIPLRTHNNIIGVMDLQSTQANAFSPHDMRLLEAFAQRAAIAIENARLYEEIRAFAADQEHLLAERTLEVREAKDQVEKILNNSVDGIVFTNTEGKILHVNPAFEFMFGRQTTQKDNIYLADLIDECYQADCINALKLVTSGEAASHTLEITATNGHSMRLNIDMTLAGVDNGNGDISGVVFTMRDVTDRKRMEEGLRDALKREKQLNELKSQFIAVVSHEFRTPLATILAAKDGLQRYYERMTDSQRDRNFNQIDVTVNQLTEMLDDLLSLTQSTEHHGSSEILPLDIDELLQTMFSDLQGSIGRDHVLTFKREGKPKTLIGNARQIRQIFTNLVSNAVKYTPQGQKIEISVRYGQTFMVLIIADSGIGIPAEDRKRIFESFMRGANVGTIRGTGLGLTIVQRAVEEHGGDISFVCPQEGGTTFKVVLPYKSNRKGEAASDAVSIDM